ncbi:hypothetical protein Tco_1538767 [Tanacetum coccineum]
MSQDKSISRRNKVDWHMANDDPILTTMRFIPQHEVVQRYGAILPDYLTTQAMKESEPYKIYHDLASGKVQPKPKYVRQSSRSKTEQAPQPSVGKKVKTTAKVAKSRNKKQPTFGLETLSNIALTKAEQLKLATKRSLIQTHSSHASGSGAHEGTGVTPGVPDVPNYDSNEEISWKSSDEDDDDDNDQADKDDDDQNDDDDQDDQDDDDDEQTESDNDGDDFVHPKFTTHEEEVNKEDNFDPRVHTPSRVECTDDEDNANETQGRDAEMTNVPLPNVQATQEIEDTHVILTALINPEGIDLIFGLNTEATLLVDVPVTIIAEPSSLATTTIPLPPTPLFTHLLQTPATVPSSSLQDLPNFGFLFRFDHRLKALEDNFYEFKQTNQFAEAVSSILGIVDQYLVNKINDAVKTVVQLQSDRLREEAQAENQEFINTMDVGMKKIIKEQVKEQVKDQVSKILP